MSEEELRRHCASLERELADTLRSLGASADDYNRLSEELAAVTQERDKLLSAATMGEKGMLARIDALQSALVDERRQVEVIKQECAALRRAMAGIHDGLEAVYLKYKHLDWLRNSNNLDPWHECVRDFMQAVGVAIGYEPKAAQQAKEGVK
jgi:chromosome segregation ATPase